MKVLTPAAVAALVYGARRLVNDYNERMLPVVPPPPPALCLICRKPLSIKEREHYPVRKFCAEHYARIVYAAHILDDSARTDAH